MRIEDETLNLNKASKLKAKVLSAVTHGDLAIDLSKVRHADSSILSVLLAAERRAVQNGGGHIRIIGMPKELLSLAVLYGIDKLLESLFAEAD